MAKKASMASGAEDAVAAAAEYGITLDFSADSVKNLERLITAVEQMARVALDLSDTARVADDVAGLIDLRSLGAYYGELFVRHAGAVWGEAEGENGPEPAVVRGGDTLLPLDMVRRRVFDGRQVDLVRAFRAMARPRKGKKGQGDSKRPE
jgi:hypothetical protein